MRSWDSNLEIWTFRAANKLRLLQVSLLKKAKEELNTWYNEHEQCGVDGILYNSKGYVETMAGRCHGWVEECPV